MDSSLVQWRRFRFSGSRQDGSHQGTAQQSLVLHHEDTGVAEAKIATRDWESLEHERLDVARPGGIVRMEASGLFHCHMTSFRRIRIGGVARNGCSFHTGHVVIVM